MDMRKQNYVPFALSQRKECVVHSPSRQRSSLPFRTVPVAVVVVVTVNDDVDVVAVIDDVVVAAEA